MATCLGHSTSSELH